MLMKPAHVSSVLVSGTLLRGSLGGTSRTGGKSLHWNGKTKISRGFRWKVKIPAGKKDTNPPHAVWARKTKGDSWFPSRPAGSSRFTYIIPPFVRIVYLNVFTTPTFRWVILCCRRCTPGYGTASGTVPKVLLSTNCEGPFCRSA